MLFKNNCSDFNEKSLSSCSCSFEDKSRAILIMREKHKYFCGNVMHFNLGYFDE